MARRRRSARRRAPLLILLLTGLALAGWAAWRWPPAWLARTPPPAAAATDVCALLDLAAVQQALGRGAVEAYRRGAGAEVPAAGACTWVFDRAPGAQGRVVALLFTDASLARGAPRLDAAAFYTSTVTGLEYAFKLVPQPLAGVGDDAVVAGFEDPDPDVGQIVVRRGDRVLHLAADGVAREPARRLATALAARF